MSVAADDDDTLRLRVANQVEQPLSFEREIAPALRAVLDGRPLPWGTLLGSLIGSLIFFACTISFATWLLKMFRRRGFVTRYS